jgi:hypothetical protein
MISHLKFALGSTVLALAACGGGDEDKASVQDLWGYWNSPTTNVLWQFSSSSGRNDRLQGVSWQGSTDGSACRITYLDYSINTSGTTISYYVTRVVGTGTNNTYDSRSTDPNMYTGPNSTGYSINGSSATIGSGIYSRSSGTRPRGC